MCWCGLNGVVSRWHRRIFGKLPAWEESCHQHDCDYVYGGIYLDEHRKVDFVTRWQSDKELFLAVAAAGVRWWPMAVIYWLFVRAAWWKWNK